MAHTPLVMVSRGVVFSGWPLRADFRISEWISSLPWTTRISKDQTGVPLLLESEVSRGLKWKFRTLKSSGPTAIAGVSNVVGYTVGGFKRVIWWVDVSVTVGRHSKNWGTQLGHNKIISFKVKRSKQRNCFAEMLLSQMHISFQILLRRVVGVTWGYEKIWGWGPLLSCLIAYFWPNFLKSLESVHEVMRCPGPPPLSPNVCLYGFHLIDYFDSIFAQITKKKKFW